MLPSAPPPPMRRPGLARAGVTPHRDAIRDALREWMRATNTSVRDLAIVACCEKSTVEKVISGERAMPTEWFSLIAEHASSRLAHDLQKRVDYAIEKLSRARLSA